MSGVEDFLWEALVHRFTRGLAAPGRQVQEFEDPFRFRARFERQAGPVRVVFKGRLQPFSEEIARGELHAVLSRRDLLGLLA